MRVLVIPEDFRNDQYLLKPLFERLFRSIGKAERRTSGSARTLCLAASARALKSERIQEIVDQHGGMTDIFILCIDRDGNQERRARLNRIEAEFGNDRTFLAENAWEEVETWALAGLKLPGGWHWADVRAEVHVKERYFDVLAEERGVAGDPDGGRETLGEEATRNLPAIRRKCPEDFDALARRLEATL